MSTDRAGTVRVSPDGVVAVKAETDFKTLQNDRWLVSVYEDKRPGGAKKSYWRGQDDVVDWEIVYTPPAPPHPVGTVMRRGGKLAYSDKSFWEVATRAPEGWYVVSDTGPWASPQGVQPPDDEDGAWEVVHGDTGN